LEVLLELQLDIFQVFPDEGKCGFHCQPLDNMTAYYRKHARFVKAFLGTAATLPRHSANSLLAQVSPAINNGNSTHAFLLQCKKLLHLQLRADIQDKQDLFYLVSPRRSKPCNDWCVSYRQC
jgi:hypothetical protein